MPSDIEVGKSKLSGRGLFARRSFSKGEVVLRWDTSHKIPRTQVDFVEAAEQHYLNPYDEKFYILLSEPERYVNHSCDNNTEVVNFCDVAIRDIASGEEITSDYRSGGVEIDFECACGSATCCSHSKN